MRISPLGVVCCRQQYRVLRSDCTLLGRGSPPSGSIALGHPISNYCGSVSRDVRERK